jgi:protein-S-isoprenylcysteine O-methyltransferase Ste14
MWFIVAAGVIAAYRLLSNDLLFQPNLCTRALFAAAAVNWLWFFLGAVWVNRAPARSAGGVERLITHGVYARVRHPIYSADIFLAWGVCCLKPEMQILASVAWGTAVLLGWMKVEENVLARRFGAAYADYQRTTPMFIPCYFRRRL